MATLYALPCTFCAIRVLKTDAGSLLIAVASVSAESCAFAKSCTGTNQGKRTSFLTFELHFTKWKWIVHHQPTSMLLSNLLQHEGKLCLLSSVKMFSFSVLGGSNPTLRSGSLPFTKILERSYELHLEASLHGSFIMEILWC